MVLEGGKPSNHLPSPSECRNSIRDSLFRLRYHLEDRLAKLLERRALRLIERFEVGSDLVAGHDSIIDRRSPPVKARRNCGASFDGLSRLGAQNVPQLPFTQGAIQR